MSRQYLGLLLVVTDKNRDTYWPAYQCSGCFALVCGTSSMDAHESVCPGNTHRTESERPARRCDGKCAVYDHVDTLQYLCPECRGERPVDPDERRGG